MSIIGHIDLGDFAWISSFCSTYQVPLIGLDNHYYKKSDYYISLMPDILPPLVAFIHRYQINQLFYLYDDTNGAGRLKRLMEMQTTNSIQDLNLISRYIGDPDDSYNLFENIEMIMNSPLHSSSATIQNQKFHGRYIVLDFQSTDTYRIVMDKIKHRGMTTIDYHYVLLTLNAKQIDLTYFRYGGVNVTYFVLSSDASFNDNQTLLFYQKYIDSIKSIYKGDIPPVESLLIADAWETLLRTINRMLGSTNEIRNKLKVFRQGKFYNGQTLGIDCRSNYIQPWISGKFYLENILKTSFHGLTGYIQFSHTTGQRKNYTFDMYRVTENRMPKHIGFFRAPTTFQVLLIET